MTRHRLIACQTLLILPGKLKAGVHLKAVFPPLNLGLMRISRWRFRKQSKNCLLISQIFVLRRFVNFWGFLGRDSFSQSISKIWRNKKY